MQCNCVYSSIQFEYTKKYNGALLFKSLLYTLHQIYRWKNFPFALKNCVVQLSTHRNMPSYTCAPCLCIQFISQKKGLSSSMLKHVKLLRKRIKTIYKTHSAQRLHKHAPTGDYIALYLFIFYILVSFCSPFLLHIVHYLCRLPSL